MNKKVNVILVIVAGLLVITGIAIELLGHSGEKLSDPIGTSKVEPTPTPVSSNTDERDTFSCSLGQKKIYIESLGVEFNQESKYIFSVLDDQIFDAHVVDTYVFPDEISFNSFNENSNALETGYERQLIKEKLTIVDTAYYSLPTTDGSVNNYTEDYISSVESLGYSCVAE